MVEVLLRSGTTPLCLKLRRDDESDFSEFQLSVLDTLAGNTMYRWKDLDIWLKSFSELDKLHSSFLVSSTHFELMKLSIVIQDAYRLEPSKFLDHLNYPRLRTLRNPFLRLTDPLDLTNLTDLRIDVKYIGGYMRGLLERCPLLQSLWVSSFHSQNDIPSSLASVCHTHLTSLTIVYKDVQFPDGVWDYVQLPNLTFLSVSGVNVHGTFFETENSFNELKTMLKYSGCILQNIVLVFVPDTAVSLFFQDVTVSPECIVEVNSRPYQVPIQSS